MNNKGKSPGGDKWIPRLKNVSQTCDLIIGGLISVATLAFGVGLTASLLADWKKNSNNKLIKSEGGKNG